MRLTLAVIVLTAPPAQRLGTGDAHVVGDAYSVSGPLTLLAFMPASAE